MCTREINRELINQGLPNGGPRVEELYPARQTSEIYCFNLDGKLLNEVFIFLYFYVLYFKSLDFVFSFFG